MLTLRPFSVPVFYWCWTIWSGRFKQEMWQNHHWFFSLLPIICSPRNSLKKSKDLLTIYRWTVKITKHFVKTSVFWMDVFIEDDMYQSSSIDLFLRLSPIPACCQLLFWSLSSVRCPISSVLSDVYTLSDVQVLSDDHVLFYVHVNIVWYLYIVWCLLHKVWISKILCFCLC